MAGIWEATSNIQGLGKAEPIVRSTSSERYGIAVMLAAMHLFTLGLVVLFGLDVAQKQFLGSISNGKLPEAMVPWSAQEMSRTERTDNLGPHIFIDEGGKRILDRMMAAPPQQPLQLASPRHAWTKAEADQALAITAPKRPTM